MHLILPRGRSGRGGGGKGESPPLISPDMKTESLLYDESKRKPSSKRGINAASTGRKKSQVIVDEKGHATRIAIGQQVESEMTLFGTEVISSNSAPSSPLDAVDTSPTKENVPTNDASTMAMAERKVEKEIDGSHDDGFEVEIIPDLPMPHKVAQSIVSGMSHGLDKIKYAAPFKSTAISDDDSPPDTNILQDVGTEQESATSHSTATDRVSTSTSTAFSKVASGGASSLERRKHAVSVPTPAEDESLKTGQSQHSNKVEMPCKESETKSETNLSSGDDANDLTASSDKKSKMARKKFAILAKSVKSLKITKPTSRSSKAPEIVKRYAEIDIPKQENSNKENDKPENTSDILPTDSDGTEPIKVDSADSEKDSVPALKSPSRVKDAQRTDYATSVSSAGSFSLADDLESSGTDTETETDEDDADGFDPMKELFDDLSSILSGAFSNAASGVRLKTEEEKAESEEDGADEAKKINDQDDGGCADDENSAEDALIVAEMHEDRSICQDARGCMEIIDNESPESEESVPLQNTEKRRRFTVEVPQEVSVTRIASIGSRLSLPKALMKKKTSASAASVKWEDQLKNDDDKSRSLSSRRSRRRHSMRQRRVMEVESTDSDSDTTSSEEDSTESSTTYEALEKVVTRIASDVSTITREILFSEDNSKEKRRGECKVPTKPSVASACVGIISEINKDACDGLVCLCIDPAEDICPDSVPNETSVHEIGGNPDDFPAIGGVRFVTSDDASDANSFVELR